MNFDSIEAGQIWQVKGTTQLALVVCVFEDELFGQDLRVLPVFVGATFLALATPEDVVIPATHNSLTEPLLVFSSNAQSIAQSDMLVFRGAVTTEALEAARGMELLGIDPRVEQKFSAWRGVVTSPMNAATELAVFTGRRQLFQLWDDIRTRLMQFRNAYTIEMPVSVYRAGSLFRGRGWNTLVGHEWQTVTIATLQQPIPGFITFDLSGSYPYAHAISTNVEGRAEATKKCLAAAGRAA
jgi:hypothetical protein